MNNPPAIAPAEIVLAAFHLQLQGGVGEDVDRNSPEPADLVPDPDNPLAEVHHLIMLDGHEHRIKDDEVDYGLRGFLLWRLMVEVEGHIRSPQGSNGRVRNNLIARVRAAALSDPTLSGLLVGEFFGPEERRHFNAIELGDCAVDIYRERGAEHGSAFSQEIYLRYATPYDDPMHLITLAEWERG